MKAFVEDRLRNDMGWCPITGVVGICLVCEGVRWLGGFSTYRMA